MIIHGFSFGCFVLFFSKKKSIFVFRFAFCEQNRYTHTYRNYYDVDYEMLFADDNMQMWG